MQPKETVFDRTYKYYLEQLKGLNFESIAPTLGAQIDDKIIKVQLFTSEYKVSVARITGPSGEKPAHDICVLLSKYLLLCPNETPKNDAWVSFRNLKDSGPLINYFTNEVEHAIATHFSQKIRELEKASEMLGGYPPALEVRYDFAMQFNALPMIPLILLFNDLDEEFPATCSMLFQSRIEKYLDAECIAMLGWQLFFQLKKALKQLEQIT